MSIGPWHEDAACREIDPELWFPGHGEAHLAKRAKVICNACEVQTECLDEALKIEANDPLQYRWGIRGGLDSKERHALALGISPHHGTMKGWREHRDMEEIPCKRCEGARLSSLRRQLPPEVPSQRKASS